MADLPLTAVLLARNLFNAFHVLPPVPPNVLQHPAQFIHSCQVAGRSANVASTAIMRSLKATGFFLLDIISNGWTYLNTYFL